MGLFVRWIGSPGHLANDLNWMFTLADLREAEMKPVLTALVMMLGSTHAALSQSAIVQGGGQQLLESYVAYIGDMDLYNSSGQRLTQPWQIIRQDRANYHRFRIRHDGDESDSFFASADNRAVMEDMLRRGQISNGAARDIVNGDVFIEVEIYGQGGRGTSVYVTTYR
jgi:hypothetical protein